MPAVTAINRQIRFFFSQNENMIGTHHLSQSLKCYTGCMHPYTLVANMAQAHHTNLFLAVL
eukprot:COSAG01_NODE_4336_length_5125_cov_64.626542_2_plen_61_part_00